MNTLPIIIAQTYLHERNFYHGRIDGEWGPISEAAGQSWKAAKNSSSVDVPPATAADGSALIWPDHWYAPATRQLIPGGASLAHVIFLIIHDTSGATGQSSIDGWKAKGDGVCAHFVVERDGRVIQCRPCNLTCGHAGASKWRDPEDGEMDYNLNGCSIGIEIANAGSDQGALAWARKQPGFRSIQARHPNGGPVQEWEVYYAPQLEAVEKLSRALIDRYKIHSVCGHEQVAPDRRDDPGPAFPWEEFRASIKFRA